MVDDIISCENKEKKNHFETNVFAE